MQKKRVYKDKTIIYTGRSRIVIRATYAEETPEGFEENVYRALERFGVFPTRDL